MANAIARITDKPERASLKARLNLAIEAAQRIESAVRVSGRNICGGYEQTADVLELAADEADRLREALIVIRTELNNGG
jgi:hypothetical protein